MTTKLSPFVELCSRSLGAVHGGAKPDCAKAEATLKEIRERRDQKLISSAASNSGELVDAHERELFWKGVQYAVCP